MLAHLLNSGDFHAVAFKGKDKTIKAGKIDSPLPFAVTLQLVAPETWQPLELFNISCFLDNIHAQDEFTGNVLAVGFFRFLVIGVLLLELARSESDFHNMSLSPYALTLQVKHMFLHTACQVISLPKG
jgi:hypothetical protein